jgi:predicted aspartyl protease
VTRAAVFALGLVAIAAAAHASDPPADAVLADLPFLAATAAGGDNEIRIDLGVPGARPLPLLLDTGSPESFATPQAAQDVGISLRRSKQTPYRRATRLGRDVEISVDTRRGDTGSAAGGEWAVLGARFLAPYVVELDFPKRRVRFLDAKRFEVPERTDAKNEAVLPLRLVNHRAIVEIEVGSVRVPAAITTGAPGTLLLPGGWVTDAAKLTPDANATAALPTMAGAGKLEAVVAAQVAIGPFAVAEVPMLVAEHGAHGAGARSEALLGVDLLKDYVLRIDYPRKRLWITEPGAAAP